MHGTTGGCGKAAKLSSGLPPRRVVAQGEVRVLQLNENSSIPHQCGAGWSSIRSPNHVKKIRDWTRFTSKKG